MIKLEEVDLAQDDIELNHKEIPQYVNPYVNYWVRKDMRNKVSSKMGTRIDFILWGALRNDQTIIAN